MALLAVFMKTADALNPPLVQTFRPRRSGAVLGRFLQFGVTAYQLVAAIAFVGSLLLANSWLKTPFLGAFFDAARIFTMAAPTGDSEDWDLYHQGVQPGEQLVSVNGLPVRTTAEVQAILRGFFPGESIPVGIQGIDGATRSLAVKLNSFPAPDRTTYFVLPAIVSFLFLALSFWIFGMRRTESAGRAFALLSASLSIVSGSLFDLFTTHSLTYLWALALLLTGGALVDLAFSFPRESLLGAVRPYVRWLGYISAIGLATYVLSPLTDVSRATQYMLAWRWVYAFAALAAVVHVLLNAFYAFAAQSPVIKTQARMILMGTLAALGPISIWSVLATQRHAAFTPYVFLPIVVFPLTLGYTILRFRFVRADDWLRQGVMYVLLSAFIVGAYALIVTGLGLIFKAAMPADNPYWIGGLVFVLAVLLDPIRVRLQSIVDGTFFRGQRAYTESLQNFAHDLAGVLDLPAISRLLGQLITSTLAPGATHVFVYDALSDQYGALPAESDRPSTDIHFAASGPLAQYFVRERLPLYLDESAASSSLERDQSRLALLGARLFVALPGRERPAGWLALGPRLSGQPYAPADMHFLENLAEQASLAIQRLQTVANLERRVQEMNALTRVSQGVNITLTFDDVLELIYAQTSQIIPLSHFHITLFNKDQQYFYLGFGVERNERLASGENLPLPADTDMAPEIIRRGRPILTHDYARECQTHGVSPAAPGISAWMGVPLNAGAESIGALTVGSRDPATVYTPGQLELLQAIADQTAGAIVKARLLRETQQRANQLAKLNEVTRQLTSTLELEPLLQSIVDGAVSTLNCEAGVLYLVDQATGDLVIRAAAGLAPRDILGQQVPAGTGIAGRAASTLGPVMDNDLARGLGSHPLNRPDLNLVPRAALAVPLRVQEQSLGVLEILNRRDELPFVEEDQTLLTALAGQSAVALENLRLYTLTDQELAARVEELSVMQRIDRELNASLELDRAMRITLEWALRQSRAEAGLIGMLEQGQLRVVAQSGLGTPDDGATDKTVPLTLPGFQTAVDTGVPQRVQFVPGRDAGLLPSSDHNLVIPIRREASVIGLLMLESTSDAREDLSFLSRLSDHAAIAISNAQLYDEVQRANVAKSDFVSLVAHELKNPMTSIKGYTELLAAGAVGAVNEMQANFLNTIHANTERMSTLVSDLNDNSKIEAGRLRLDFKAVEVSDLVDEILRSTKRQIEEKKQVVQAELPPELPKVWGDPTRIGQVLTNLVSNAHKYTPEGGALVIGAESSPNHWDPEGASRVVHFWLRDNGIGISPEDQPRIFQKFFRSEDTKAREVPGAGLGLNITRSLVEMQGGRIWFESQYRQGTTFHFTVPVAEG
jgi:signal transduction histidine kinase